MNTESPDITSGTPSLPAARRLLRDIEKRFPVIGEYKPLAIGIDKQLFAAMPELEKKLARIALSLHTNSTPYLKGMLKGMSRFNLDGTPAGDLEEAHRKHASDTLRERFKVAAQKKRAKEEEEKAQHERAEKLQKLAEKFSPRR
ncbi:ProQ/FINO family protein [Herbaspirillum sp. ST 5-3]|uniref:ProQ/FINO family protein n=1 Tax=Oxalobacteraceae TaxID=75682 RepID=UPI0010A2FE77|nr:ProQ/FINO family protein [Herbaspirillum sp. ST 5-3]